MRNEKAYFTLFSRSDSSDVAPANAIIYQQKQNKNSEIFAKEILPIYLPHSHLTHMLKYATFSATFKNSFPHLNFLNVMLSYPMPYTAQCFTFKGKTFCVCWTIAFFFNILWFSLLLTFYSVSGSVLHLRSLSHQLSSICFLCVPMRVVIWWVWLYYAKA